jgi:hypothetical protein
MARIERKPLPPPNFNATTITEADRAEMIAHANAVIDYYLNGPGSYWDAGPRKPLVSERGDSTVNDLRTFKEGVIASKQFADDPGLIMDSIIGLIDQATQHLRQRTGANFEPEDCQSITGGCGFPQREGAPDPSDTAPQPGDAQSVRVLSCRLLPRGDIGRGSSSNSDTSSWLVPPSQSNRPLGLLTGEPMPRWPVQLPIWDFSDRSGDSRELKDPSVPLFEQYIRYLNQTNGV